MRRLADGRASTAARPLAAEGGRKYRYEAAPAGVPPNAHRQRDHGGQDTVSARSSARGRRSGPLRRIAVRVRRSEPAAIRCPLRRTAAAWLTSAALMAAAPPSCRTPEIAGWLLFRNTRGPRGEAPRQTGK